jgi:hypothetical protein
LERTLAQSFGLGGYSCGVGPAPGGESRGHLHDGSGRRESSRKRRAGAGNLARRCQLLEQRGKGETGEHLASVSAGADPRESDLLEEPAQPANDER